MTGETLNKDIKLEYKNNRKYDRKLVNGDWVQVEGIPSLKAAIRVKLMTIFGELQTNPTYSSWGNKAWFTLKDIQTPVTLTQIREYTRIALLEMRRIASVDYLNVYTDPMVPEKIRVEGVVTSIEGDEVQWAYTSMSDGGIV